MRINLLGPIHLTDDHGEPVDVSERHLRVLLVSLAAAEGHTVSADTLADRLWGASTERAGLPEHPGKVLRAKLSRLRSVLERASPGSRSRLRHTPAGYLLDTEADSTDAGQFSAAVRQAMSSGNAAQRAEQLQGAVTMWRGEPFGDLGDEPWLAAQIAELNLLHGDALEALAETRLELGEPEAVLALVRQSPVHQSPAQQIGEQQPREKLVAAEMTALYQLGRQSQALQTFETLRRRLAEDLGIDPSPQLQQLHGSILRQEPQLLPPTRTPSQPAPHRRRSSLPAETSPLIGRQSESAQVNNLLRSSRLVVLTGAGGVGKTRLATRVAHDAAARFEHGAWFVDFTDLPRIDTVAAQPNPSGERIAALVGAALELPQRAVSTSDTDQLAEVLEAQSVLLVLDNTEHITSEAAEFTAQLLRRAPGVHVLATSREPLGLPDEHRYEVAALHTEPAPGQHLSQAAEFFAVRAQAADSSFRLTEQILPAVAELTRRLDGLPLALELAAARVKGISVQGLLERLCYRLDLLARSGSSVPDRQQTLRAMIDWSWSLLTHPERTVLRRIAVRPGSMTLDTLEAITSDPDDAEPPLDPRQQVQPWQVADIVGRLVDRSMLTTVSSEDGLRYRMLESVAAFAAEKLQAAGEAARIAERHSDYYLQLATEAHAHLRGPQQRHWLQVLGAERAQLRHAFCHAVSTDDGARAVSLTVATFWYQWIFGCHSSLSEELDAAVALPGPSDENYAAAKTLAAAMRVSENPRSAAQQIDRALALFPHAGATRAQVQWFAGASLLALGDRSAGEAHMRQAIRLLDSVGEDWDLAVATTQRDWFLAAPEATPSLLPDGRDPEEVLRGLGEGWGLIQALTTSHQLAEFSGDYRRAAEAAETAMQVALEYDLRAEASYLYSLTAVTALRAGDIRLASERVSRSQELAAETSYLYGECAGTFAAAMIARYTGDLAGARSMLEQWRSTGGPETLRNPLTHLERGFLAVTQNDSVAARQALRSVEALTNGREESAISASVAELSAGVHALAADPDRAAAQLQAAAQIRERLGVVPHAVAQQDISHVQAMLAQHQDARGQGAQYQRAQPLGDRRREPGLQPAHAP